MTVVEFDTVGASSWLCPTGVTKIDVEVVGGAGGGGTGAQYVGGGGGAATANTQAKVTVVPGTTYITTVGDGGAGAVSGSVNGSPGIGSILYIGAAPYITSNGGAGGNKGTDNNTGGENGAAGPGSGIGGTGVDGGGGHTGADCTGAFPGGVGGAGAGGGGGGGGNLSWGCAVGLGGKGGHGYITITYTAPSAAFSGTPTSGDKPLTVDFTGPAGQTTYAWDFGDGQTADTQSPQNIYATAGKKTVLLATTNAYGFASETKVDYITAYFKSRMYSAMIQSDGLRWT